MSQSGYTPRALSFETKLAIDHEVQKLLGASYERVKGKLKENEPALHRVAQALLQHEVLDGKQIKELVQGTSA